MIESAARSSTGGVILLYRPTAETADNVARLARQVNRIYLVNNSPGDPTVAHMLEEIPPGLDWSLLDQSDNSGVAAGFNAGLRAAFADGHDQVVIFDQDSTVTPGFVSLLSEARSAYGPAAGIVGPALRSAATGLIYRREAGSGVRSVDVLISSGSLIHRETVAAIGLHDEGLFIDYVDHDICLRARQANLVNLKVFAAILDHRFGDSDPVRLMRHRVYLANYSLERHFFAARNRIIVIRRYGLGLWFWADLWFTAKAWAKLLLFEENRRQKCAAAWRGVRAGLRYPARRTRW